MMVLDAKKVTQNFFGLKYFYHCASRNIVWTWHLLNRNFLYSVLEMWTDLMLWYPKALWNVTDANLVGDVGMHKAYMHQYLSNRFMKYEGKQKDY